MSWFRKKSLIQQVEERKAREEEYNSIPTIGQMSTPEEKQMREISREAQAGSQEMEAVRDEQKKEDAAVEEQLLVIDGAKIKFNSHLGEFKVL
ncbi:MAG: hypothetical protein ACK5IC_04885, partial [Moheibacter sp.]